MTDITDQDTARLALAWAEDVAETFKYDDEVPRETRAAVNYILATVDAPAPTLSEELRTLNIDQLDESTLDYLADRAEKIEQDAEDRQEWNRNLTKQVATLTRERDEARAEVNRLTAERVTDPSPDRIAEDLDDLWGVTDALDLDTRKDHTND